jgi:hypothetical protein
MKTYSHANQISPSRGSGGRPVPQLCNWMSPARCREPGEVTFESGLGYCRTHARAVQANRAWLLGFFENWQLAKQRERNAKEESAHASCPSPRRVLCGNGS